MSQYSRNSTTALLSVVVVLTFISKAAHTLPAPGSLFSFLQDKNLQGLDFDPTSITPPPNNVPAPSNHPAHPHKSYYYRGPGQKANFECPNGMSLSEASCTEQCHPDFKLEKNLCVRIKDSKRPLEPLPESPYKETYLQTQQPAKPVCPQNLPDYSSGRCYVKCDKDWLPSSFLCFYVGLGAVST